MAGATLTPLPPAEAIAALVRRGQRLDPTFSWQDAWEADHAAMFTVAKSAGFDILKDIHAALVTAISEGTTFEDFAKTLRPVLQAKGWWGRQEVIDPATGEIQERVLGSTRRLAPIFNANMRVSYAVGHWSQFERNRVARPVLRYVSLLYGKDRRKAHIAHHNLTLPIDDPYWDRWAPPSGWGCQCTLQSLSLRDVERMRGELKFTPPAETMRAYTNTRTGEVTRVPDGIDPGWAYNPGKAGWRASTLAEKLIDAPPELAAAARADASWPVAKVADEFQAWFRAARDGAPVQESARTVGALDAAAIEALARTGRPPASAAIVVEATSVPALAAIDGPATELVERLPETIAGARAVMTGAAPGRLHYVADVPGEPERRAVIEVEAERVRPGEPRRPSRVRGVRLIDAAALIGSALFTLVTGNL